ncbi:MAG: M67 family metallopeptidase [Caldilineaceae bacterium]
MNQLVQLPSPIYQEIIEHSRLGKPEEICGILRGRGTLAKQLIRAQNIAEERIDNYLVDPNTLLRQFEFEESGDEMMGIYHSHPTSPAYPSATDAWNAGYPDTYYLICSLEDDNAPVLRAFRMIWQFMELDWQTVRQSLAFYETRPGLFAYYHSAGSPLPPFLQPTCGHLLGALYLVYYIPEGNESQFEGRLVTVQEYPIEIV